MGIRWRLGALGLQIAILLAATTIVVGRPYANEIWFFAGLLAVVINPQLLEPHYPRPGDVIANSIIFVFLYLTSEPGIARPGWHISAIILSVLGTLALVGVLGPKVTEDPRSFAMAGAARSISQLASAQRIYSVVFFLALLDFRPSIDSDFWILAGSWVLLILFGTLTGSSFGPPLGSELRVAWSRG